MNISSYKITDIPHVFSDSERNAQDTTEEDQPSSKKVKMVHHSVSKNSDLTPKSGTLLAENKCNDKYNRNLKGGVIHKKCHLPNKNKNNKFECDKCKYTTDNKSNLTKHKNKIHKEDSINRNKRTFTTDSEATLKVNKDNHKSDKKPKKIFKCNDCHFTSIYKRNLTKHTKNHTPIKQRVCKYNCKKCELKTDNKYDFEQHIKKSHTANKDRVFKFKCDECTFGVDRFSTFTIHKEQHIPTKNRKYKFKCNHCKYKTNRPVFLIKHQNRHKKVDILEKYIVENNFKCDKCDHTNHHRSNFKKHLVSHIHPSKREKNFKCDSCDYRTENKSNLKQHGNSKKCSTKTNKNATVQAPDTTVETTVMIQTTHITDKRHQPEINLKACEPAKENVSTTLTDQMAKNNDEITDSSTEANKSEEAQFIKVEKTFDDVYNVHHCYDNRAPLFRAQSSIKREFTGIKKKAHTYFFRIKIKKTENDKARIRKAMSFYKQLDDEDREIYLNERMLPQKHDGSIVSALKNQNEIVAARGLTKFEIIGHYAGQIYTEDTYTNDISSMGATRNTIDNFSVSLGDKTFISGFRFGNVTSLINACKTYSASENNMDLPKENVSFLQHYDNYGRDIVFIIALKHIKTHDRLWVDYGKEYWNARSYVKEIIDTKDNPEKNK
ncbi:MAG: hypothetical protein KAG53_00550 [Endozoicomonadaceae bacterium]|nr:hypothetical protein [Endozoicomonadaceae bacterium]